MSATTKRKHSSEDDEARADCYAPALPPHLLINTGRETKKVSQNCSLDSKFETIGPVLPPHLLKDERKLHIGPVLPSHLIGNNAKNIECQDDTSSKSDAFGPALPPHLRKQINPSESLAPRVLGPSLPPHLINQDNLDDSEDDDATFGPLPPEAKLTEAHIALEERALYMKMEQLEPNQLTAPVREEWMLELPEISQAANLGLGPRQFRSKNGPDMSDRSSWTKVAGKSKPSQKEIKVDLKKEAELRELERRDKEQEKMAKKHKKRDKTLLESHQDKLKEKKKGEGSVERRPFSRETDLQVNRFDEAQKKAVLKKAEMLDDRFSSGKAKYL